MLENNENPLKIDYKIDYREVKYPRLEYKTGNLILILPKNHDDETKILEKYKKWIICKETTIKQALEEAKKKTLNLDRTDAELRQLVHSIVNKYRNDSHLEVNQIFFRRMRTKWASFSSKGNLTINSVLKYLNKELIQYIIFHEMTHSLERKHNVRFWRRIETKFNDVSEKERELLVYWFLIQKEVNQ